MNKIIFFFENLSKREKVLSTITFILFSIFLSFNAYEFFLKDIFIQEISQINILELSNKNINLKQEIKNISKKIDENEKSKNKNFTFLQNCNAFIKEIFPTYQITKKSQNINIEFKENFLNTLKLINSLNKYKQSIFIKELTIENTNSILLKTNLKLICLQKEENE